MTIAGRHTLLRSCEGQDTLAMSHCDLTVQISAFVAVLHVSFGDIAFCILSHFFDAFKDDAVMMHAVLL